MPSSFFSIRLVSVHVVHPYSSIDTTAARNCIKLNIKTEYKINIKILILILHKTFLFWQKVILNNVKSKNRFSYVIRRKSLWESISFYVIFRWKFLGHYYFFTPGEVFTPSFSWWFFNWSWSDSKSLQVSRTLLSILGNFISSIIWTVSVLLLLFFPVSFPDSSGLFQGLQFWFVSPLSLRFSPLCQSLRICQVFLIFIFHFEPGLYF